MFANPAKKGVKTSQEITYDVAQKELAKNVGIASSLTGRKSKGIRTEPKQIASTQWILSGRCTRRGVD